MVGPSHYHEAQPQGIQDPGAPARPSRPPPPTRSPVVPHPSPPLTPSSAHGSTPQRGRPRRHGHTAGRDLGASPAGKPEWRHPGLQGTGSTGPRGQAEGQGQGSPGLLLPSWLFAHRPQQYRGAGAKLSLSAMSEGRLSSDARHSGLVWLVSLPGGMARTPAREPPTPASTPAMWRCGQPPSQYPC